MSKRTALILIGVFLVILLTLCAIGALLGPNRTTVVDDDDDDDDDDFNLPRRKATPTATVKTDRVPKVTKSSKTKTLADSRGPQ
jgi:hypothetical protein